jgi:hypothetical protein
MRSLLRLVLLLNAGYIGAVGVIGALSPTLLAALFRVGVPDPAEAGIIRLFSGLLLGNALALLLLSRFGPEAKALGRWVLINGAINLFCQLAAALGGDLRWGQLMVSILGQVAMLAVLGLWLRAPPVPTSVSSDPGSR